MKSLLNLNFIIYLTLKWEMQGLSGSDFKFSSSGLYGYTESLKKSIK